MTEAEEVLHAPLPVAASGCARMWRPGVDVDEELGAGTGADEELPLAPRVSSRTATRTSSHFGAVEVGPPVSRLVPTPEDESDSNDPGVQVISDPSVDSSLERCPSCSARVRTGQDWCSLCHASLRPEPVPAAEPVTSGGPASARLDTTSHPETTSNPDGTPPAGSAGDMAELQLELDFEGLGTDPATTPDAEPPNAPALDEAEVARMLRTLAASDAPMPRGLSNPRAKVLISVGGGLGLTALLLGGMTLLGAITG
ncbi:MAG: hypothetical protein ACRYF3_06835 [Janthinobacterium lividum]